MKHLVLFYNVLVLRNCICKIRKCFLFPLYWSYSHAPVRTTVKDDKTLANYKHPISFDVVIAEWNYVSLRYNLCRCNIICRCNFICIAHFGVCKSLHITKKNPKSFVESNCNINYIIIYFTIVIIFKTATLNTFNLALYVYITDCITF